MSERYNSSEEFLKRAERVVPLGSQTFSKSKIQYPVGISPLFFKKSKGCFSWDIDNNKYIDLVSSLASVTLGYSNRDTDRAVRKQLRLGVTLSLPGKLEAEVAEMICELVPSAEMVRFGKNGTDATSAAVRLARAFTGRDHVLVCGYHGWQDWFIGSTSRNKGVPSDVSKFTHTFEYNNLQSLEYLIENLPPVACVVMEPMNTTFPSIGFLEGVREITRKHGIILVFDETITGFRFDSGGAQKLFNVTPDLSTFGKGIANGFPLSVVTGKKEIMMEMENIFISGTFGGELLSLAVAKVVLEKHVLNQVTPYLSQIGENINNGINQALNKSQDDSFLSLSGHPSWTFLMWKDSHNYQKDQIRTFFMQEMFKQGLLVLNSHNVSLAMNTKVINRIISIYQSTILKIEAALFSQDLDRQLKVKPNEPLFKVR